MVRWPTTRPSESRTSCWTATEGAFCPAEPVYWARAGAAANSVAVAMSAASARSEASGMEVPVVVGPLTRGGGGRSVGRDGGHPPMRGGNGQDERLQQVVGGERSVEVLIGSQRANHRLGVVPHHHQRGVGRVDL